MGSDMNVTKRLEALESAVARHQAQDEPNFIFIRSIAPETKDEPMWFATYEGQLWERGSDESEDAFESRLKGEIVPKHGTAKYHLVMFSVDRRDRI